MSEQLTGRIGFRRGLFGRLIPQVEVLKAVHSLRAPPPPGTEYSQKVYAAWCDVVAADVLALGQMVGCTAHKPLARSPRTPAVEVE